MLHTCAGALCLTPFSWLFLNICSLLALHSRKKVALAKKLRRPSPGLRASVDAWRLALSPRPRSALLPAGWTCSPGEAVPPSRTHQSASAPLKGAQKKYADCACPAGVFIIFKELARKMLSFVCDNSSLSRARQPAPLYTTLGQHSNGREEGTTRVRIPPSPCSPDWLPPRRGEEI